MRRHLPSRGGALVVIEGLDGAGTTTQTAAVVRELVRRGTDALGTCQPSDGPVGMLLRQALTGRLRGLGERKGIDSRTLALLFAADRADHVAQVIEPALVAGRTVVCDRYLLSSLAYQGMDLGLEWVEAINAGAPTPAVTVFLDIDPGAAQVRLRSRGAASGAKQRELFDALAVQRRVAAAYRDAISHRRAREPIVVLDGTHPVPRVTRSILRVMERFGPGGAR